MSACMLRILACFLVCSLPCLPASVACFLACLPVCFCFLASLFACLLACGHRVACCWEVSSSPHVPELRAHMINQGRALIWQMMRTRRVCCNLAPTFSRDTLACFAGLLARVLLFGVPAFLRHCLHVSACVRFCPSCELVTCSRPHLLAAACSCGCFLWACCR